MPNKNYQLLYTQILKELAEAKQTISDNNQFFGEQMMALKAENAKLKQEIKRMKMQ